MNSMRLGAGDQSGAGGCALYSVLIHFKEIRPRNLYNFRKKTKIFFKTIYKTNRVTSTFTYYLLVYKRRILFEMLQLSTRGTFLCLASRFCYFSQRRRVGLRRSAVLPQIIRIIRAPPLSRFCTRRLRALLHSNVPPTSETCTQYVFDILLLSF